MGWFEERITRPITEKQYITQVLAEGYSGTVRAVALVNHVAYIAYTPKDSQEVVALVFPIRTRRRGGSRWLAHTPMDETVGPVQQDCPARILDMLTPTEHAWANDWRTACRANLDRKRATAQLADGTRLRFAEPLRFRNGRSHQELTLRRTPGTRTVWFDAGDGCHYRIPAWQTLTSSIIPPDGRTVEPARTR